MSNEIIKNTIKNPASIMDTCINLNNFISHYTYNKNVDSEEANDAEWINNFVEKSTKAAETLGADFTGVFLDSLTNGT